MTAKRAPDRRIQKTRTVLHEALVSLIHEKEYDSIVVKEILHRANVGRSTFYTHFRDKDELFVSGIHEMLRALRPVRLPPAARRYEKLVWFSLPVLEHLERQRRLGASRIGPRGAAILHQHLQGALAELIADDVKKALQRRRKTAPSVPASLLTQHIASTFVLVLNWWLQTRSSLSAENANDLFLALVVPALAAVSD